MGEAGQLLRRAEIVAYWLAVAPLTARLPASLAYGVACWRGDQCFRYWPQKRAEVVHGLREVLGEELSEEAAERVARDVFRSVSCQVIDVMRLRGRAESLERLVEIRGREHLDAALAGGKGAILCSAHCRLLRQRLLAAARQRVPAHHHRALVVELPAWRVARGAAVLGHRLRPAHAASPAAAEHRAVAGPGAGRGAGRGRAPRQRGSDDLQRRRAA